MMAYKYKPFWHDGSQNQEVECGKLLGAEVNDSWQPFMTTNTQVRKEWILLLHAWKDYSLDLQLLGRKRVVHKRCLSLCR